METTAADYAEMVQAYWKARSPTRPPPAKAATGKAAAVRKANKSAEPLQEKGEAMSEPEAVVDEMNEDEAEQEWLEEDENM